jgi:hypothetical protein
MFSKQWTDAMREMILAGTKKSDRGQLNCFLINEDFVGIFTELKGLPATIRFPPATNFCRTITPSK